MSSNARSSESPPETAPEELYERFVGLVPEIREALHRLDTARAGISRESQRQRERLLQKHREELAKHAQKHREELAKHDHKRRRLSNILKELGDKEPKPKRPASTRIERPGNAVLLSIINGILAQSDDALFTALGIHEQIGATWSQPHTYTGFSYLRQAQFIGMARREDKPNGRVLFRILDREVGEEMKRVIESDSTRSLPKANGGKKPSDERIATMVEAIHTLGKPRFTTREVNDLLGYASPKGAYEIFRYLRRIGYLGDVGKAHNGAHAETLHEIINEDALTGALEETDGEEESGALTGSQSDQH